MKDNMVCIGIGACGGKMVKEFYNNSYQSFFINTSYQDLEALNIPNSLIYHIPNAYGCAKNRQKAIEYAKNYYESMIGRLLDVYPTARTFLIHYSLGGGTGSGTANLFSALLSSILYSKGVEDFKIINICAKPKSYESYQIQKNAKESLEEMYAMVDKGVINQYFIINNDSRETLEEINEEHFLLFERWIEGEDSNNVSNVDESERADLFSYSGNAMIFEFASKDFSEFKTNIQREYSNSIYCVASKEPTALGLALNSNIKEEEALETIEETVGYYSNTHITPTESSNLVFVSGIVDKGRIVNQLTKLINNKANKINTTVQEVDEEESIEEVVVEKVGHKKKEGHKKQISIENIMSFYK